jgi:hypothetical protein
MGRVHNPESLADHNKNFKSQINHRLYPPTIYKQSISENYSALSPLYQKININDEAKKKLNPHGDQRNYLK